MGSEGERIRSVGLDDSQQNRQIVDIESKNVHRRGQRKLYGGLDDSELFENFVAIQVHTEWYEIRKPLSSDIELIGCRIVRRDREGSWTASSRNVGSSFETVKTIGRSLRRPFRSWPWKISSDIFQLGSEVKRDRRIWRENGQFRREEIAQKSIVLRAISDTVRFDVGFVASNLSPREVSEIVLNRAVK